MAQLIEALAITGSRKSDGSANASGKLWAYVPGTTTPITLYADYDATTPLTQPVTLNAAGKKVAYVVGRADIVIEDSTGATLDNFTYGNRDALVEVVNDGFTGTLASGSQGAGGITDLDAVLTAIATSTGVDNGSLDAKFRGRYGTVSTTIWSEIEAVWINAKRFEAVGDGVHDDTTNIQAASNAATAQGGGVVYLPPGTYKISAAITVGAGVVIRGAGRVATTVRNTSGTGNAFTITGTDAWIDNLAISHSSSSTGDAISAPITGGSDEFTATNLVISAHRRGVASTAAYLVCDRLTIATTAADAAARGIRFAAAGTGRALVRNCVITASTGRGVSLEMFAGSFLVQGITVVSAGTAVLANQASGVVVGCTLTGTTAIDFTNCSNSFEAGNKLTGALTRGLASNVFASAPSSGSTFVLRPLGGGGSTTDVAGGGSITPNANNHGNYIRIRATSAGTININAASTNYEHGSELVLECYNNSGGAVTWTMDAIYKVVGVPVTANGQKCTMHLRFDGTDSTWIQSAPVATVTA